LKLQTIPIDKNALSIDNRNAEEVILMVELQAEALKSEVHELRRIIDILRKKLSKLVKGKPKAEPKPEPPRIKKPTPTPKPKAKPKPKATPRTQAKPKVKPKSRPKNKQKKKS
jgi:outer membrane biosynthesis protein TonB